MKRLILGLILISTLSFSQTQEELDRRAQKLELIMRFQDLRTIHDGKLISFLSDNDPLVRERAVFAFGSIQDTSVLHLLIRKLDDKELKVQKAAAFAIGQTGLKLSPKGRKNLEDQIIWKKLGYTSVDELLIEELGKFGTYDALDQLMILYGTVHPRIFINGLSMSVARFAIRGIYHIDAVKYLTRMIKPDLPLNWKVMYALMRVSSMKESYSEISYELNYISQLYKHPDPLVRMNLAIILGRLQDERYCLEPLMRMAEYDTDWRVRVNALKAISNYNLKDNPGAVSVFKRAFYNDNMHIGLTALQSFGNLKIDDDGKNAIITETFDWLRRMVENHERAYRWQYQGEAMVTLAKLFKEKSLDLIRNIKHNNKLLHPKTVQALGYTESKDAINDILKYFESQDPMVVISALEGMNRIVKNYSDDKKIIDDTYQLLIKSLESRNTAVVATTASILCDSIFLRTETSDVLLNRLGRLRTPDDTEAIDEIIQTLGRLKDDKSVNILRRYLQQSERALAESAANALLNITGKDYSKDIQNYMQPVYVDFDFSYLKLLPDRPKVKIETIRGDIVLELYPDVAPFTVLSFLRLAEKGFYRGTVFHRIVPNFVIQGGDPDATGWGGPGYSIRSEFSQISFDTGYLGMASSGKDTEGSQFFITQSPQPHLDGRYTVFGKVIGGLDKVYNLQNDERVFDIKRID